MSKFVVPQLRQKLKLLLRHGGIADFAVLAQSFGISEEGLRFWTKESAGRVAGSVPDKHVGKLIGLFSETLPNFQQEQVRVLLEGPLGDMEQAYQGRPTVSFTKIVETEGICGVGKLIPMDGRPIELIQPSSNRQNPAKVKHPLGADFRIEFCSAHRGRFTLGLQKSTQAWGCVSSTLDSTTGIIRLPENSLEGELQAIFEDNDQGPNQFIAIQATKPFPAIFGTALQEGAPLSRTDLQFLALFLTELPKPDRRLFVLNVEFTKL